MPLDRDILALRWGATSEQMPLVEQVAAQAQALCEAYTGRRFDLAEDEGDFNRTFYSFQVPRYPIVQVFELRGWLVGQLPGEPDAGPPIAAYRMDKAKGLIWPGGTYGDTVHCRWEGGFATWPYELTWAVTQAADIVWQDTPGGGAPAGSGGGASLGVVKRVSVVGVYSAEIGDTSGTDGGDGWGVLPVEVSDVLDTFRPAAVVGIG